MLIADKIAKEGLAILSAAGLKTVVAEGLSPSVLARRLTTVDGVIVRSATTISADVLSPKSRVKVIGRAGIGVDNIDVEAASMLGIAVLNTPDANAATTAELALAHMFSLSRRLIPADRSVRSGKWERKQFVGVQICGKVVGVVGFGTIGRIVAVRSRGLEMTVLVYDPFVAEAVIREAGCEPVELAELLRRSDYVSLHTPLSDATRNLIDVKELALMKQSAFLIHCARGGIVSEPALAKALASGGLAGAALDVYTEEPPTLANAMLQADNVVFTPHLGASTVEAQKATGVAIAKQMVTFFTTGEAVNAVNLPRIPPRQLAASRPYLPVARALGMIMGGCCAKAEKLEVGLFGEVQQTAEAFLVGEALAGFLAGVLSIPVNMINALRLAEQRGIEVSVIKEDTTDGFSSLLRLRIRCGKVWHSVSGTLLGTALPRLVFFDDIELEAPLVGSALLTQHKDRPGVVATLGHLLAKQRINITNMHVGAGTAGRAAAFIGLARDLPVRTLAEIRALPAVTSALALSF